MSGVLPVGRGVNNKESSKNYSSPKRISGSLSVVSGELSVDFDELLLLVIELKNTTDN